MFSISGADEANHSGFGSTTALGCVFGIAMDAEASATCERGKH